MLPRLPLFCYNLVQHVVYRIQNLLGLGVGVGEVTRSGCKWVVTLNSAANLDGEIGKRILDLIKIYSKVVHVILRRSDMVRSTLLAGAALVAVATGCLAYGTENICKALYSDNFFDDMQFMATTGEICRGACNERITTTKDAVGIRIFSENMNPKQAELLNDSVKWAIGQIDAVIGENVDIAISENSPDGETSIYIFFVDSNLDKLLSETGLPGLPAREYIENHRPLLIEGACSARVISVESPLESKVRVAFILIGESVIADQPSVDSCVLEELTQSFGLFGDPKGRASLFDGGNSKMLEGRISHSHRTLAMLRYLYSGHQLREESFRAYRYQLC
ncbi:hypothetical protein [uncultured Paracoccus sp.]|uniref:hypothetical protein n=1 Tax=uncultured Paracoccus sp. TaxID=189685 RepID=UPI0025F80F0F|nr:hypothetical protein [uncultured Paracoccus sp.]